MEKKPVLEEIASTQNKLGLDLYFLNDAPGQILQTEAATNRYFRSVYELYEEMEDKDAHLFSVLQTRKNGVLARERRTIAASENPADLKIARFVEDAINSIPNLDQEVYNILDALGKGFSVSEIMWKIDRNGKISVDKIISRAQSRFIFDPQGRLLLLDTFS